jgi:YggT family protein
MAASSAVIEFACTLLFIYSLVLLARVILSWVDVLGIRLPATGPVHAVRSFVIAITEPVLGQLRRIVPAAGMFDLSVLVAFIIIFVLQRAICRG